jgi:hypothetical protein
MNWKKRGQKGWLGKKTAKEVSKGRERQYGDQDVKQQLQEDFEGDDFRYTGGKKKKNKLAQLENWRDYYERRKKEGADWLFNNWDSQINKINKQIEELKKKL